MYRFLLSFHLFIPFVVHDSATLEVLTFFSTVLLFLFSQFQFHLVATSGSVLFLQVLCLIPRSREISFLCNIPKVEMQSHIFEMDYHNYVYPKWKTVFCGTLLLIENKLACIVCFLVETVISRFS